VCVCGCLCLCVYVRACVRVCVCVRANLHGDAHNATAVVRARVGDGLQRRYIGRRLAEVADVRLRDTIDGMAAFANRLIPSTP
jgi:hypothetical protein